MQRERGHLLEHAGVLERAPGGRPPGERPVTADEHARHALGVAAFERLDDHVASSLLVRPLDLGLRERARDRDLAAKVVGMGRPEGGDRPLGLRPGGRPAGVGVDDGSNLGERSVEDEVRRGVRRRLSPPSTCSPLRERTASESMVRSS